MRNVEREVESDARSHAEITGTPWMWVKGPKGNYDFMPFALVTVKRLTSEGYTVLGTTNDE